MSRGARIFTALGLFLCSAQMQPQEVRAEPVAPIVQNHAAVVEGIRKQASVLDRVLPHHPTIKLRLVTTESQSGARDT